MLERNKCKFGELVKSTIFLLFLFASLSYSNAQTLSNLDVLYKLVDTSVVKLINDLPPDSKRIVFKSALVNDYLVFQSRILSGIKRSNREIFTIEDSISPSVTYTIENINVNYSDVHKDGIFSDYQVKREIKLTGNFLFTEKGNVKKIDNFILTNSDTINYDDINRVENPTFPFTRGDIPAEPFFSSLFEPVVAIGCAAVAVYLFFNVRSK